MLQMVPVLDVTSTAGPYMPTDDTKERRGRDGSRWQRIRARCRRRHCRGPTSGGHWRSPRDSRHVQGSRQDQAAFLPYIHGERDV
ncbi:hypothetical protein VUR80DRAFT_8623 [Thermomyces stellatus]